MQDGPGTRMAEEPNRNRKSAPSEPFFQKPKEEPEPSDPFFRNRNRNRLCQNSTTLSREEPSEPRTLPSWGLLGCGEDLSGMFRCSPSDPVSPSSLRLFLGGRFGYFDFFWSGGGEGGVRGAERRRGTIFIENPRRGGGLFRAGGGGGRGAGSLQGIWGGGG